MARFQEAGHAADAAQIVWLLAHQRLHHRLLISCIIKGARQENCSAFQLPGQTGDGRDGQTGQDMAVHAFPGRA